MSRNAANALRFQDEIQAMIAAYHAQLDRVLQAAGFVTWEALTVGNTFSPGTPVDQGFAVNSWWVRIGRSPDGGTHPNPPTTPNPGERLDPAAAFQQGAIEIAGAKFGDVLVFSNGAAYIIPLEFGHSPQAPGGWVRLTVAQWQAIVERVVAAMPV